MSFLVSMIRQFMHSLGMKHFDIFNRILRSLKWIFEKRLLFKKHEHLHVEIYTNVKWVGVITHRISTSGYCTNVKGNLVIW